ncbi:MAG: response regulator [Thermodesulfovibrionales bacterium]
MKTKKVLIVDDEVIQAMALEMLVQTWDFETCEPAVSGSEAIDKAGQEMPDVIVMDINIQGERSGIETARRIIADFGIPVIFMTGYAEEDIHEEAKKLNPLAYLVKPFDPEALRAAIAAAPCGTMASESCCERTIEED